MRRQHRQTFRMALMQLSRKTQAVNQREKVTGRIPVPVCVGVAASEPAEISTAAVRLLKEMLVVAPVYPDTLAGCLAPMSSRGEGMPSPEFR